MVGDLADFGDVTRAVDGVAAVLHLACVHGFDLTFEASLDGNYRSTVNLLDALTAAGVERLVYASSHHVLGLHPVEGFVGDDAPVVPDAYYGLGKAFGELACRMYAERYGTKTLTIRIGNADPQVSDARALRLWTSARDLSQLVQIGLTHPDVRPGDIVYGVSRCAEPLFANERALELGYRPQDHSADHLASDYLPYQEMPPRLGRGYVGGGYAVVDLPRRGEQG